MSVPLREAVGEEMVFQKPRQMGGEMGRERRWLKSPLLVLRHRCQGKQPRSLPNRSKQSHPWGVRARRGSLLCCSPTHRSATACATARAFWLQLHSLSLAMLQSASRFSGWPVTFLPAGAELHTPVSKALPSSWLCTPCSGPQSWLLHRISFEKPLPTLREPPFLAFFPSSPFVGFLSCLKCLFPHELMSLSSLYHQSCPDILFIKHPHGWCWIEQWGNHSLWWFITGA